MGTVSRLSRYAGSTLIAGLVALPVASIALVSQGQSRVRLGIVVEVDSTRPVTVAVATTPGIGLSPGERAEGWPELNRPQEKRAQTEGTATLIFPDRLSFCRTKWAWKANPPPRAALQLRLDDDTYLVSPGRVVGRGTWRVQVGDAFERQPDEPGRPPLYLLRVWATLVEL
jgi:hypothetical protein